VGLRILVLLNDLCLVSEILLGCRIFDGLQVS
jgi:hypothetical protein